MNIDFVQSIGKQGKRLAAKVSHLPEPAESPEQVGNPHGSPAALEAIDRIDRMPWEKLGNHEVLQVAYAYRYFSIQFRENLEIASNLFSDDSNLKQLLGEECNTDNLSPYPRIAEKGEKLDHDEFIDRLLSLQAIDRARDLQRAGTAYLATVRRVHNLTRAKSLASYEGGGLTRVFRAMLRAPDWSGAGQRAFRFFLQQHIRFDSAAGGGHGALSRHLLADDGVVALWRAFEDMLIAALPKLSQKAFDLGNGCESSTLGPKVHPMRRETIAIHGGYETDPTTKAVAVPIYQTVAYEFDSAEHGAALFNLESDGYRYSRISNPTTDVLDRRVAALEGGLQALSVSSGQAALHYAVLNLTELGKNIVSVPQLYGTTYTLFAHLLPSLGVGVRFAASDDPADIAALIDRDTRAVFCESVGNPAGNICDIEALANVAHENGVPLIVDNTVATPILLRPIEYGADIVVHSLTKFMGGHGTTLGGAIVDSGKFPWKKHAGRFPMFNKPDESYHGLVYSDRFGPAAYIARCRSVYQRTTGAVLPALSAFLLLQGIETIALRVERHVENARRVAEFLRRDSRVAWVNYAGFPDSPYHRLAEKYLAGRACSLLSFGHRGGFQGGVEFYNALKLIKRLVNLGDAKSLACHPASTTHRQMSADEQRKAGVSPEMIRLSVGVEHADDIIADLHQALDQAERASRQGAAGSAALQLQD